MISHYNYIAEISEKEIKKIYSLNGKAHLLKGGYDGFINFLKTENTWTDLFWLFYKGLLYDNNWKGEICIIKNIAFYNGLLRIEIRNLTFPYSGYALLDIEQCKIVEAHKIHDPEEPQPAFKPKVLP